MLARDFDRHGQRTRVIAERRAVPDINGLAETAVGEELRWRCVDDVLVVVHERDVGVQVVRLGVAVFVLVDVEATGAVDVRGGCWRSQRSRWLHCITSAVLDGGQECVGVGAVSCPLGMKATVYLL